MSSGSADEERFSSSKVNYDLSISRSTESIDLSDLAARESYGEAIL